VECCRDEATSKNAERGRQKAVESEYPLLRTQIWSGNINVSTLTKRVHAGIGASGSMDPRGLA
jgi:hypothetical protein